MGMLPFLRGYIIGISPATAGKVEKKLLCFVGLYICRMARFGSINRFRGDFPGSEGLSRPFFVSIPDLNEEMINVMAKEVPTKLIYAE